MKLSLMFPNDYLSADELDGKDCTLTISRIQREKLRVEGGTEEDKWIVYFAEMEARHKADPSKLNKRIVLNKTNATTIAGLYGNESNDWIGKRITLYPTTCLAFGERVDCIRVRGRKPA